MQKFIILLTLIAAFSACRKKDDCRCNPVEDCIEGTCVLQPNSFWAGNSGVTGFNLYKGVVNSNVCIDSIAFDINTVSFSEPRYNLYVNIPPNGLYEIPLALGLKISDNEYVLGSGATICHRPNGKQWYPSYVHCITTPDSVVMNIKFLEWFDTSNEYVDSCRVTLYK